MIHLGEHSYIVGGMEGVASVFHTSELYIGKWCAVAGGLTVMLGGNHPMNLVSTFPFARHGGPEFEGKFPDPHPPFGYSKGDIIIENDVWIGQDVTLMSGIRISSGAVVGTNSTVTKDVPAYAVVAGNPAEIRKFRFDPEIRWRLLKVAWWDWPIEKIVKAYPLMNNPNIELFLKAYDSY